MMVILGIVVYNLVVDIIEEILNYVITQIASIQQISVTSPSVSGFAGWVVACLKIPECLAVVISIVMIKFTLRKIPFLRW